MLVYIILIVLFGVIIYLLFMPIILHIDTACEQYFLEIKGLVKATIEEDQLEVIKVHLKVLFFNFDFYPLKKIDFSDKSLVGWKTEIKKHRYTISFKKILSVLKSFKIRQFRAEIDTGDCIFNSKLYPTFTLLNFYKGTQLSANFEGKNSVLLSLENRLIRIIKAIINE